MKNIITDINLLQRQSLQNKTIQFNEIIKSGFNFSEITKEKNPKEYFGGLILNKIYSLNVSIENSIFCNDVFLSIYLYRYIFELFIKVNYIFSDQNENKILKKLEEFYANKQWILKNIKDEIDDACLPPEFKDKYEDVYKEVCRFVHPNINSLKLHLNRTDDQQFKFLVPNVRLTIWYAVGIVKCLSDAKILNFHQNIDQNGLELLRSIE